MDNERARVGNRVMRPSTVLIIRGFHPGKPAGVLNAGVRAATRSRVAVSTRAEQADIGSNWRFM